MESNRDFVSIRKSIEELQDQRVKVRQDALDQVNDFLAWPDFAKKFSREQLNWMALFQGLSIVVNNERNLYVHKASAVVTGRLEKAGRVMRNAIERNVTHLKGKVVDFLLTHLTRDIKGRGTLLQPVSLNYVKSMVAICSYSPHIDHIKSDQWTSLVVLALSVISGDDSIDHDFPDEDELKESFIADLWPDEVEVDSESTHVGNKRTIKGSSQPRKRSRNFMTPAVGPARTISQEQVEFMELLLILLKSPHAPYLKDRVADGVVHGLARFFKQYRSWTIAHTNAISSVNVVMSQLELNRVKLCTKFGLQLWPLLLSYWSGKEKKDKIVKEELIIAFTTFFYLATAPASKTADHVITARLESLLQNLQEDIDRLVFDSLPLESLRFDLASNCDNQGVFKSSVITYGAKFESPNALSWGILSLYADCIAVLHQHFDDNVRIKTSFGNPIVNLVTIIKKETSSTKKRCDYVQVLFFLIDRHWSKIHDDLQAQICSCLLALFVHDDLQFQSWVLLCLANIAAAPEDKNNSAIDWQAIWTQAIYRANVVGVARAAAHTAHILLAKQKVTTHLIHGDIETFASNLVIQGPSFPYDGVCAFLCDCLQLANQDMRLYNVQLPDKVLVWLMQSWNIIGSEWRHQLPPHSAFDILNLLQETCGLVVRLSLPTTYPLPESVLVNNVIYRHQTRVHRDFLLFHRLRASDTVERVLDTAAIETHFDEFSLQAPSPRETKASHILIRLLESLVGDWKPVDEGALDVTPEKIRRTIDLIVVALFFEALLTRNGIQPDRRVLQLSYQLIPSMISYFSDSKWKPKEGAMLLDGLRPLIYHEDMVKENYLKDLILKPSVGSGVRRDILAKMSTGTLSSNYRILREIQYIIWRSLDIQRAFASSKASFLDLLLEMFPSPGNRAPIEGDEDFAPYQAAGTKPVAALIKPRTRRFCIDILMGFLTFVPVLQSGTTQPEHSRDLFSKLLECEPMTFRELAGPFLKAVQKGHVHFSLNMATEFLNSLEKVLTRTYQFACSVESNLLAVQFLYSTSHLWIQPGMDETDLGYGVQLLHDWLAENIIEDRVSSWQAREYLIHYLEHYLTIDPNQTFWTIPFVKEVGDEEIGKPDPRSFPSVLLPRMSNDEDVRVRLRGAVANGNLLIAVQTTKANPIPTYEAIKSNLSSQLDRPEFIWARSVHLANAMIVSSAVRRGAYWHLLETCLYDDKEQSYKEVIQILLEAIASRLGYRTLHELFETYAAQLMQSFILSGHSFFLLPHSLLGYDSSRACAQRTFPLLGPMILTSNTNGSDNTTEIFLEHCSMAKLTFEQGMSRCFPVAIAIMVSAWIDTDDTVTEEIRTNLKDTVEQWVHDINPEEDFTTRINAHLDLIIFTILRTVRDTDYSKDGSIVRGFRSEGLGEHPTATFVALNAYRKSVGFTMHEAGPPAFDSQSVIRSILWLKDSFQNIGSPHITYHVIHRFIAAIESSTLINEQLRLFHGLTIWISMNIDTFSDMSILRLLIRGTVHFLSQYDIARIAQGIIAWSLGQYRVSKDKDSSVSEVLGYIAKISYGLSRISDDPDSQSLGTDLMSWIEKEVILLYEKSPEKRGQIHDALVLWPREFSERLALISLDNSKNFSSIFKENLGTSRFRIVKKLAELDGYSGDVFCRRHFWYLKNWIPDLEEIQEDDIDGFTELLFKHSFRLRSPDTEFVDPNPLTELHLKERGINRHATGQRGTSTVKSPEADLSSFRSIVRYLLRLLASGTPSQVHRSYTTLRQIFGLEIPQFKDLSTWESKFRKDVLYFMECPFPAPPQSAATITDLETISEDTFDNWIRNIAGLLNRILSGVKEYYSPLSFFIEADAIFAQQILPLLVHALLIAVPSARTPLSSYFNSIVTKAASSKHCGAAVETVVHLRNFQQLHPKFRTDPLGYDKWLDIDFRLFSRGAIKCGAYTTSLLFLELAAEYAPSIDIDNEREEILYHIYSHIKEPDGFYAIKSTNMFNFLTRRFHHEGQWDMAFRFHGAELAAGFQASQEGVSRSLHAFGFDNLAISILQSKDGGLGPSKLAYEMAWRTQMWDLPKPQLDDQVGATLYVALRAVHRNRDHQVINDLVKNASRNEMQRLRHIGNEDMVAIEDRIRTLICLGEIRRWKRSYPEGGVSSALSEEFLRLPEGASFTTLEDIVATRLSLLSTIKQREKRDQLGDLESPILSQIKNLEKKCLLKLSGTARAADKSEVALNAITRAKTLESTPSFEVLEELSNVLWLLKEHKPAAEGLRAALSDSGIPALDQTRVALALSRLGTWWAEACFQKPADIQDHCFLPALDTIQKMGDNVDPSVAVVFHQCALFAESQYHSILSSPAVVQLKEFWEKKSSEVAEWEQSVHFPHFKELLDPQMKAFAEEDKLYKSHFTSCRHFLVQAVQMYSSCLAFSDEFDDSAIIRLCSLWFANFELQTENSTAELVTLGTNESIKPSNEDIEKEFGQALLKVASRKFIFLAHQLSARLDADKSSELSQIQLRELIIRMCREHPFHSLYQVCALTKINQLPPSAASASRRASGRHPHYPQHPPLYSFTSTGRARAASSILAQCCQFDEFTRSRVVNVELLCKAYLEFATWSIKDKAKGKSSGSYPIPNDKQLARIVDIPVPPATAYIPIDLSLRYKDIVTIARYGSNFYVFGGQAVPKICECIGSNGIAYRQLFKGEGIDDLRQDAIMEQAFELINVLLKRDRETKKRELGVRTYKVIPLSHNAGVIEFVRDTQQFGDWLRTAHPRYNTTDISVEQCSTTVMSWRSKHTSKTPEEMRDGFIALLKRFHPVFRHFFTELHKLPVAWFGSRLRYARSVATTSIVGYILGLGDRHTKNILIDKVNGEMVHIDLGIAFDQGLRLRVPELVPFRLTQNVIDGLGTTGTEGVFRRCAEETLRVLRRESGVILSVLEVFKHDPLYQWATTADKIHRVQGVAGFGGSAVTAGAELTRTNTIISQATTTATRGRGSVESEKDKQEREQRNLLAEINKQEANRALNSVRRKLDQSLSIEYVVNDLITSATDPMNLGQIFVGWNAWW